ncbi:MAG: glycosyltransferase [Syntrophobacteraceae bacterium]
MNLTGSSIYTMRRQNDGHPGLSGLTNVAVIILTYNEEENIAQVLDSVAGWARQIFVLDSYSTDRTVEIAGSYPSKIVQHRFENYSKQRNFALDVFDIQCEWVLFLDADEWVTPELKQEISDLIESNPAQNGFCIKWRFIFMGRWIRRGYYPTWILRLFRFGKARCESRTVNEHLIVEGDVAHLNNDLIHEDRKSISDWIDKHNRYARMEARELLRASSNPGELDALFFGTQAQRKRWFRNYVWNRLPPIIRPFFFFIYRYLIRGGFLDGRAAFIFHFLQTLWFPLLVDVNYLEMRAPARHGETGRWGSPRLPLPASSHPCDAKVLVEHPLSPRSPTILTFSPFYLPGFKAGGPIRTIANMVYHLGEEFRFKIFTSDRDWLDTQHYSGISVNEWIRAGKAEIYYCSVERLSLFTVLKILSETQYDILYLTSFFSPKFSILPLLLRRLKLVPEKPTILAPRGELGESALKLKSTRKQLYLWAAGLINFCFGITWHASTFHEKQDIIDNVGNASRFITTEQILIAEDLPAIHRDPPEIIISKQHGRLNIVFLSRICRMKNLGLALDVLSKVKSSIVFHIYGPIDDPDYWEHCQRMLHHLPENVKAEYRGIVKNAEVVEVIGQYDLFFLPTLGENFGHVIWEAMLAGCPVLISDRTPWSGLRELGAGWDLPLSETDGFREIIENCANMCPEEHLSWAIRARSYALSKMDSKEAVERNVNLFRSAMSINEACHDNSL